MEETVGELIRAARKKKGMSAEKLGELLEPPVTFGAVYGWEKGKAKPNADTLWQISEILEVDIRQFFAEPGESRFYWESVSLDDRDDARELCDCYSKMSDEQKAAVLTVVKSMVD